MKKKNAEKLANAIHNLVRAEKHAEAMRYLGMSDDVGDRFCGLKVAIREVFAKKKKAQKKEVNGSPNGDKPFVPKGETLKEKDFPELFSTYKHLYGTAVSAEDGHFVPAEMNLPELSGEYVKSKESPVPQSEEKTSAKHSPAPFGKAELPDDNYGIWDDFGNFIARIQNNGTDKKHGEANANLFLAAPEMLEALKLSKKYIGAQKITSDSIDAYLKAKKAIIKAEGE